MGARHPHRWAGGARATAKMLSEAEGLISQLQTYSVILNISSVFFFFFFPCVLNPARENLSVKISLAAQMKAEFAWAERLPAGTCLDQGTATDYDAAWVPGSLGHTVVAGSGTGGGCRWRSRRDIQRLTSSFLLGRHVHMPSIQHKNQLVSLESSRASRMK